MPIERRRSINFWRLQAGVLFKFCPFLPKKCSFLPQKWQNKWHSIQNGHNWGSNQEWRSIGADMVCRRTHMSPNIYEFNDTRLGLWQVNSSKQTTIS